MKKFISFAAYVLFASVVTVSLTACSDDDKDDNGGGGSKFETQYILADGVSFKMVAVEGGTFQMGSPASDSEARSNERPQHAVTVSDFYIGDFEVSQALWKDVMGSNPSSFQGNNRPVENVSWEDCQKFIAKLNQMTGKKFRLPTEAEWEYAARGGSKSKGYKYAGSNNIGDVAWYYNNSNGETHNIGKKAANELGLYDMSGNVWEWCSDRSGNYSASAQTDPTGSATGSDRMCRGGGKGSKAGDCRVAARNLAEPDLRIENLGLRLAMDK